MAASLLLFAACASPPAGLVTAAPHPDDPHAAVVTVALERDADVHVAWGEAGAFDRATPSVAGKAGETVEIEVLGLRADRTYALSAVVDARGRPWSSATQVVRTPPLPDDWPACEVTSDAPPGTFGPDEVVCTDFFLEQSGQARFACVDREGHPVFQVLPQDGASDVMVTTPTRDRGFATVSFSVDRATLYDEHARPLDAWTSLWFRGRTRFSHDWIDGHEIIQLDEGPWAGALALLTASVDEVDGTSVWGGGVIVFDPVTEEVLWDWTAHGEEGDGEPIDPALPYARKGPVDYGEDWQHSNALVHGVDADGQFFLISMRHQDWIVKVDVETDEVAWRLGYDGDFELVEDLDDPSSPRADPTLWFFHQHAPELRAHGDRFRLLVFDNGNQRVERDGDVTWPNFSRVVELEVDEEARRARVTWEHGTPDRADPDHFFAWGVGDADLLWDGDRVQYTVGVYSDSPHVAEVAYPDGGILWKLECDPVLGMYRVASFPSLYERTWWYDVER